MTDKEIQGLREMLNDFWAQGETERTATEDFMMGFTAALCVLNRPEDVIQAYAVFEARRQEFEDSGYRDL